MSLASSMKAGLKATASTRAQTKMVMKGRTRLGRPKDQEDQQSEPDHQLDHVFSREQLAKCFHGGALGDGQACRSQALAIARPA